MFLNAARRCTLNSFGSFASSTVCRCARTSVRPCDCVRTGTRNVSGDRDPSGKLGPEEDETSSATPQQTETEGVTSSLDNNQSTSLKSSSKSRKFIEINLFGPKDARAPFPGNLGISPPKYDGKRIAALPTIQQFQLIQQHNKPKSKQLTTTIEKQVFDYETIPDRQTRVIEAVAFGRTMETELHLLYEPIKAYVDIRVFDCPQLISNDLKQIFQAKGLDQLNLLMITINENASNTSAPSDLRVKTQDFIERMCEMLNNTGFWCDFISPDESGINLQGKLVSSNTIEACERYRHFAFTVEKHDNCRLIKLNQNQKKTFFGSLFTNATLDAQPLKLLLDKIIGI